jgi:hypothetical protein
MVALALPLACLLPLVGDNPTVAYVLETVLSVLVAAIILWTAAFHQQFIVDKDYGALKALSTNWEASKGHRLALVFGYLLVYLITVLPAVAVGYLLYTLQVVPLSLETVRTLSLDDLKLAILVYFGIPMLTGMLTIPFTIMAWNAAYLLLIGDPALSGQSGSADRDEEEMEESEEEEVEVDEDEEEDRRPRRRR